MCEIVCDERQRDREIVLCVKLESELKILINLANISCCIVDIDILNIIFFILLHFFFLTFSFRKISQIGS